MARSMLARLATFMLLAAVAPQDAFLQNLQRAVARDDRPAVAALVQYPITIMLSGVRVRFDHAAALLQSYDAVFTPEMKAAVRDGSAFRTGLIQLSSIDGGFRIVKILEPPHGQPTDPPVARPRPAGIPRRVTFAMQEVAQLSGALAPGQTESYVVSVEKNRLLDVRIERVAGREVVLKLFEQRSGKPIDASSAAGVRSWTGRVPESSDYRIDVSRAASGDGQSLPYVLVVRRR